MARWPSPSQISHSCSFRLLPWGFNNGEIRIALWVFLCCLLPHLEVVFEGLDFHDFLCFLSMPYVLGMIQHGNITNRFDTLTFSTFSAKNPFHNFHKFQNFKFCLFLLLFLFLLFIFWKFQYFLETSNMLDTCRSLRKNIGAPWWDLK